MNPSPPNSSAIVNDPDIRKAEAALRRAAADARALGERTKTPVYVLKGGRIIDLITGAEFSPDRSPQLPQS